MLVAIFLVFVLSVAALMWALFAQRVPLDRSIAVITTLVNTIFGGIGLVLKLKSEKPGASGQDAKPITPSKPFRLAPSFKSGFLGGLVGGGLAGLVNGVAYYFSARHAAPGFAPATWADILFNFSFGCVAGAVFGSFGQFFIMGTRHLLADFILSDVIGGVLGGGLGGALMGFWAGQLFGQRKTPEPDLRLVFGGGILCAICIVLGVLLYDHKERGSTVKRTLIVLLPVMIVVATVGWYVLMAGGFNFASDDQRVLTERGAMLGALIGSLWGLALGGTLALYRVFFKSGSSRK